MSTSFTIMGIALLISAGCSPLGFRLPRQPMAAGQEANAGKADCARAEHITDMLLARYKLPLPDRKPQQLNKSDKVTFLPVLPPGLRAALDVAYHEMDMIDSDCQNGDKAMGQSWDKECPELSNSR